MDAENAADGKTQRHCDYFKWFLRKHVKVDSRGMMQEPGQSGRGSTGAGVVVVVVVVVRYALQTKAIVSLITRRIKRVQELRNRLSQNNGHV